MDLGPEPGFLRLCVVDILEQIVFVAGYPVHCARVSMTAAHLVINDLAPGTLV